MKKLRISDLLLFLASVWALVSLVFVLADRGDSILGLNSDLLVIITFVAAVQALTVAIKTNNRRVLLYGALGLSCLALGNAYFEIVDLVMEFPLYITVGTFSQVCCYLFFLSMLIKLKSEVSESLNPLFAVLNGLAIAGTFFCVYAVAANSIPILRTSIIILDGLCILVSLTLLTQKNARFFAAMLITLSTVGIVLDTGFVVPGASEAVVLAAISVLYLLFTRSIISLKGAESLA